jgi:hypothetical protein
MDNKLSQFNNGNNIIPENQINNSSKSGKFIYFLIFFIIPVIIIALVIVNFISNDSKYKKLKFPPYDFKNGSSVNPNGSSVNPKGIIPDGETSTPGCTIVNGVEKCGCPILHYNSKDYPDLSSGCPSIFSPTLKKGCGDDSTLSEQMMSCYGVRNCDFEKNALSHNRCIEKSNNTCPDMWGELSLAEQKNICSQADKSYKTLTPKNGCKFNKKLFGNTCEYY